MPLTFSVHNPVQINAFLCNFQKNFIQPLMRSYQNFTVDPIQAMV